MGNEIMIMNLYPVFSKLYISYILSVRFSAGNYCNVGQNHEVASFGQNP